MDETIMHKTKSLLLSMLLSLGLGSALSTQAAVITFDDLPATELDAIPDGYNGFNWGASHMVNVNYFHKDLLPNTGFENGVVSGDYAAFNFLATTSTITGYQFDFNFLGINSLSMRAWGGTSIDGTAGNDFFIMDNFTINESTAVPESSSLALLLLGVAGMLLGRKTRKA